MSFWSIVVIGVGLSMDACAVAICNVLALGRHSRRVWWMPVAFGGFQALMPLFGYVVGTGLSGWIGRLGPVLVAIVLGLIGANMLRNALSQDEACPLVHLSLRLIFLQAVATAIDALFVGVSFGATGVTPWSALIIGLTTTLLVAVTILIGRWLGTRLGNKAELVGGTLLIIIAIKSLL